MLSADVHRDWQAEQLRREVAKTKLAVVYTALEDDRKAKGSWPATLGELFVAGKLDDDALLVPGDPAAEAVLMPTGVEPR